MKFRRKSALQHAEEVDDFEKITYYRNHTTAETLEVLEFTRENICIEFIILKKKYSEMFSFRSIQLKISTKKFRTKVSSK